MVCTPLFATVLNSPCCCSYLAFFTFVPWLFLQAFGFSTPTHHLPYFLSSSAHCNELSTLCSQCYPLGWRYCAKFDSLLSVLLCFMTPRSFASFDLCDSYFSTIFLFLLNKKLLNTVYPPEAALSILLFLVIFSVHPAWANLSVTYRIKAPFQISISTPVSRLFQLLITSYIQLPTGHLFLEDFSTSGNLAFSS